MNPFDALIAKKSPEEMQEFLSGVRSRTPLAKSPKPVIEATDEFVAVRAAFLKLGSTPNGYDRCKAVLQKHGLDRLSHATRDQLRLIADSIISATPPPQTFIGAAAPPFSALCECGLRYGAHRIGNYACPNQTWRCGNGEPQWLEKKWKRA